MSRVLWSFCALGLVATASAAPPTDIGTAAPVSGYQAPPHAKWFVVCQARKDTNGDGVIEASFDGRFASGDSFEPYFVIGSGAGMQVDHIAASSLDGKWVAVVRGGVLELFDTVTAKGVALPAADITYDWAWSRRHEPRFASIGPAGTYMTYLTKDAIVIRELATGTERNVKVKGQLWRADIEPGDRWAKVQVLRADTNRDGKIQWAGGHGGKWMYACTSDTLHRRIPDDGDDGTLLWLDLKTGAVVEDATVIAAVGDELLRRRIDRTLVLGTAIVGDSACRGHVTAIHATPPRAVINCGTKKQEDDRAETPVRVVGPAGFVKVTAFKASYGGDEFTWDVYSGKRFRVHFDKTALDLATGEVIAIPDDVAGFDDHLVLIRTAKGHAVFDLTTRKTTLLTGSPAVETHPTDIDDGIAMVGDKRWDAVTGAQLTRTDVVHRRMADGRYLVTSKRGAGPLRLVR